MSKLTTREIQAILQAEKADALGALESSELSKERSKALEYYLGDENLDGDMPASEDRSKAVSSDVADTVEGLMPSLIEIFASGDDVIQFEPVGPEDEDAAQQETDYVNHVFWHKNHGFLSLYSFLKDGLLQKNGIVKVWWDETEDEERETYEGLDDDAFAVLIEQNPDIEIEPDGHREYQEPIPGVQPMDVQLMGGTSMMPPMPQYRTLHDVTIVKRRKYGCAKVEPVPPEEFGISRRARSVHLADADYCYHEVRRTQSDLIASGYEAKQVDTLPTAGFEETEEEIARNTVEDTGDVASASANKANRLIRVTEHYVKLDMNGNGKARLYKITTAGGDAQILRRNKKDDIEEVDQVPFAAATPIIMTHRFFGRSVADLVLDIQRIKTALLRSLLDNIYLANNQRIEIAESHMHERTLDDLLTNRPGGIVRTKAPGGLVPIPNQSIGNFAYPMLEYQDAQREWRTGVTRQGQGIDAKALADQSATAAAQLFSMAQARMRLIARIFAETGVRDLFQLLHATIQRNGQGQTDTIRLRNKWVTVDPRNWKTRNDMTVNVGIASGSKDQQMAFLTTLLQIQREAIQVPQTGLVQPGNIYATLKKIIELANLKSIEQFFTDPDERDQQGNFVNRAPPAADPKQAEAEAKAQVEKAKIDMDRQRAEADALLQDQKMRMQAEADARKASQQREIDLIKIEAEKEAAKYRADQEMALKREQMSAELALKREQLGAELALKREIAMAGLAVKAETGAANSGTSDVQVGGEPG